MLDKYTIDTALHVLDNYYGLKTIQFKTDKLINTKVMWVPPQKILNLNPIKETVLEIKDGEVVTDKQTHKGIVLVAAGVWTEELLQLPKMKRLTGTSLHFRGATEPKISVWAPYKQSVMFNLTPTKVWFGDGTSIIRKNFKEDVHVGRTVDRATKHGFIGPTKIIIGQRPAVDGYSGGYFERVHNNTWVSTGGAKNGTILAAAQAYQFLEAIS